ncbi:hypothetical protein [Roseivirga sp.]|uniref:hypothetical protein n=1 Tax=Roseivirga sp. TaxID=1964215 RepID=UPI003B8E55BA
MAATPPPEENLKQFQYAVSLVPEMELKGKNMWYTSMNGNMYTYMGKEGILGIRLGKAEYEAFREKYKVGDLKSYGAVMREYVPLPQELFEEEETLKIYMEMTHAYAKTLPPKPTKK